MLIVSKFTKLQISPNINESIKFFILSVAASAKTLLNYVYLDSCT